MFDDGEGFSRSEIRVKWWLKSARATCREVSRPDCQTVPDLPEPAGELASFAGYGPSVPPVFVGHCWM